MKAVKRVCDKCKKEIPTFNEAVQDTIDREYPNQDICPDCNISLTIAAKATQQDLIYGLKPGSTLKKWLKFYE